MAVFDVEQQRVCVRVVYDGVASAGKTTNVRQLAEIFAAQRTRDLFSPSEIDGRTLYFDWLQIAAGMVCGFPLVCQVITVPGQVVLTPRRRHLLSTADVVVHVCDSEEHAVARALDGLDLFDTVERERGERIPLVIQANKQDQPTALSGTALSTALGRSAIPVVEAIAADSIGVVDTFVAAVRAVVRSVQLSVEAGKVRLPVRRAESVEAVLEQLSAVEVDPEWALEMMLEEASNAFVLGESLANASVQPDDVVQSPETPPSTPERLAERALTFPREDVPTGFIWPAHTGRVALRSLASEPEFKKHRALDAEGTVHVVVGEFVLSTGSDRRFETTESARQALVRAARERTQLGSLLAPETVLVVQRGADDSSWLWTILPNTSTVEHLVVSRETTQLTTSKLIAAYGTALVEALRVETLHGMALDLSPRSFGLRQGAVRYLGDLTFADATRRDAGRAIESALTALANICDDLEPAIAALETGVSARFTPDELSRLGGSVTWSDTGSLPVALRDGHKRLQVAFSRGRKAA